ncbi:hypothetical protein OROGR_012123 [Orobanche gracilis]
MASMSFEEFKAKFPRSRWDEEHKEKLVREFRSLPEDKKEALIKFRLEERMKKDSLPDENKLSAMGSIDINKCFPFNSPRLSPSEFYQHLQTQYMEYAELAIKSYNKEHHSDFEAVTVESLNTYGGSIWHHEMTFTAMDAKDPSAASLSFEADVTFDIHAEKKVVYCRCCQSDSLVVQGKNVEGL